MTVCAVAVGGVGFGHSERRERGGGRDMAGKHRADDRPSTAETVKLTSAMRIRSAEIDRANRESDKAKHRKEK